MGQGKRHGFWVFNTTLCDNNFENICKKREVCGLNLGHLREYFKLSHDVIVRELYRYSML
jgi:hypothetical protein